MPGNNAGNADGAKGQAAKPKRVRTGCLTCRERHLKCDEGLPTCLNCAKSNRQCRRGVRLNFIDMNVKKPPVYAASEDGEWIIRFLDESREIASEYKGGMQRYGIPSERWSSTQSVDSAMQFDVSMPTLPPAPTPQHQPLPSLHSAPQNSYHSAHGSLDNTQNMVFDGTGQDHAHQHSHSNSGSAYSSGHMQQSSMTPYGNPMESTQTPSIDAAGMMSDPDETFYMQVFVEEVGCWMDSMDPLKHFSRLLPFHALSNPMLHNAFLACGARHMFLVNSAHTSEAKALSYYDSSTRDLLNALQDPNRDIVICATTAVILNVYELMGERALQRMNHIAGARALIKECRWSARASGVGAACFWLNVGMEVLSCLHFNWQVAWNPDEWGVDMNFSPEQANNREELWTHRMLYIVGKICNFRAVASRKSDSDPQAEAFRKNTLFEQWKHLKGLADSWDQCVPRTMQPMSHIHAWRTRNQSSFPEIWLIKRTSIVARLFYHTAMVLLAQTNPYIPVNVPGEMQELQRHHSVQICGIVRHTKDRGIASVALRSIHIAGETLTDRREQEEVYSTIKQITENTGWNVKFMFQELPEKWGWQKTPSPQQQVGVYPPPIQQVPLQTTNTNTLMQYPIQQPQQVQPPPLPKPAPAPRQRMPAGIVNPMYAHADFTHTEHPYATHYVPPNPMIPPMNYSFTAGF